MSFPWIVPLRVDKLAGWRAGLLEKTERLCDFRIQYGPCGAGVDLCEERYLDVTRQKLDVDLGSRFSGAKGIKKS